MQTYAGADELLARARLRAKRQSNIRALRPSGGGTLRFSPSLTDLRTAGIASAAGAEGGPRMQSLRWVLWSEQTKRNAELELAHASPVDLHVAKLECLFASWSKQWGEFVARAW